uniref:Uncharacterized protein n=1 Tax=Physcomitrium patens TaxID=3218 RepID=A0A2K1L3S0_PHYPA|nr:hypothetical protein PHYPA_003471 [Physcomitrium patens]
MVANNHAFFLYESSYQKQRSSCLNCCKEKFGECNYRARNLETLGDVVRLRSLDSRKLSLCSKLYLKRRISASKEHFQQPSPGAVHT